MTSQIFTTSPVARELDLARFMAFARAAYPGKSLRIEIKENKPQRSRDQNAALFGVAYPPIMEYSGLQGETEKEQLHADFCGEFFGWVDSERLGMARRKPKRTTTKDEQGKRDVIDAGLMSQFYQFVQRKAAEFGCYVPDPDPMYGVKGMAMQAHYGEAA